MLSPYTWIGVLLLISIFIKKSRLSKRLVIIAFLVLFLAGNRFIAGEFMRAWELPVTPWSQLHGPYDVGIVLGGGMVDEDKADQRLIFRKNTDRILQTISLYKQGTIKKILLSGGAGDIYQRDMKESCLLKKYLVSIGIPDSVFLLDSVSDNTYEGAVISKELLKRQAPNGKYLLITSSFHMRRAAACFRKQGLVFDTFTTNKITGPRLWNPKHLLIPSVGGIFFYESFNHELTGYISYKIMGYI